MGGKSQTSPPAPSYPAGFNPEAPRMGEAAVGSPGDFGGFDQFRDALWGWRYNDWLAEQQGGMEFGFEMPDFGAQAAEQQAAYQAQIEKQRAEAERKAGEQERDQLYSDYLTAAEASTDYINNMLTEQQANAALTGTKFDVNDEMKSTMINDYFATTWGAGDQQRLDALFTKWGNPEGFEGYTITRGDASKFAKDEGGGEDTTKAVSGKKRGTLATGESEEEDTLAQGTLLTGGA